MDQKWTQKRPIRIKSCKRSLHHQADWQGGVDQGPEVFFGVKADALSVLEEEVRPHTGSKR